MPKIYRVTPNDSNDLENKKTKYVIIKNGKVKNLTNKEFNKDIANFTSNNLIFQIVESHVKDLKKHIEKNIENFNENFPEKFLELLKDKYDVKAQATVPHFDEEEELLGAISKSTPTTPILSRPISVRFEDSSKVKTPSLSERKAASLHDLSGKVSPEISSLVSSATTSSQNSVSSQGSLEQGRQFKQVEEIRSFFSDKEHYSNFKKMEHHGNKIKNGFFNGNAKSKILLEITDLAKQIRENSNTMTTDSSSELKQMVLELNEKINDDKNLNSLAQYRGLSQSVARFFGFGKVTSIDYVNQLRNELNPLVDEVLSARPNA